MEYDQLIRNDQVVQQLSKAIAGGLGNIRYIPNMVKEIIEKEMWKERRILQSGEIVQFTSFAEFVTTPPLEGLGASMEDIRLLCRDDEQATRLLLEEIEPINPNGTNRHTPEQTRYNNIIPRQGDDPSYKLARLKRDNPELAQAVINGELSAHAAAVEAGFANPKVSINLRNLESAAGTICRKLDRDEVLELIDWLYKTLGEE